MLEHKLEHKKFTSVKFQKHLKLNKQIEQCSTNLVEKSTCGELEKSAVRNKFGVTQRGLCCHEH